jgi:hypothetical protein
MYSPIQMTSDSELKAGCRIFILVLCLSFLAAGLGIFIYLFVPTYQSYQSGSETRSSITVTSSLLLPFLSSSTGLLSVDEKGNVGIETAGMNNPFAVADVNTILGPSRVLGTDANNVGQAIAYGAGTGINTLVQTDSLATTQLQTLNVTGMVMAHSGIISTGNVNALGGIQTPILNANFLSTDAQGYIHASAFNASTAALPICSIGQVYYATADGVMNCQSASSVIGSNFPVPLSSASITALTAGGNQLPSTPCSTGQLPYTTATGILTCQAAASVISSNAYLDYYLQTGTSWTMPSYRMCYVGLSGAGGGGGGGYSSGCTSTSCSSYYSGAGGGGGAFIENIMPPLFAGMTITYSIGVGGAGGTGGINTIPYGTAGASGTVTTVTIMGTVFTAAGGSGGTGGSTSVATGGASGAATSGTLFYSGAGGAGGNGGSTSTSASSGGSVYTMQGGPPSPSVDGGGGGGASYFAAGGIGPSGFGQIGAPSPQIGSGSMGSGGGGGSSEPNIRSLAYVSNGATGGNGVVRIRCTL